MKLHIRYFKMCDWLYLAESVSGVDHRLLEDVYVVAVQGTLLVVVVQAILHHEVMNGE